MKRSHQLLALAAALLLLGSLPAMAAEGTDSSFSGQFLIGFRSVDVNGAQTKFNEDINLDDGPRLFQLSFDFVPEEALRTMVDRVQLDVNNLGGDPFETMRLSVRKFGSYNFRFDRRKSDYFYEDQLLPPELVSVSLSSGGDFHHFNFERVHDSAQLDININSAARFYFGFDRFTKIGESTTTIDIQRDEFEFDKPIDESLNEYLAGIEYAWDKVTLTLQERIRDYENAYEIFLPGFSLGENTTNAASLDFYFLNQPYDSTTNEHTVRLVARPNRNLILRGSAVIQNMDLDLAASESSQGIGFNGQPFTTSESGSGQIKRDVDIYDFDLTYLVNDRLGVIAKAWQRNLDQSGSFTFGAINHGEWNIDTNGFEAGLQYSVTPQLLLSGGVRYEERDAAFTTVEAGSLLDDEKVTTQQDGYYATAAWNPNKTFRLTVDWEDFSYDDPFTLTSPNDRQRLRVRGQVNLAQGFNCSASYLINQVDNDSGWSSDFDQLQLQLGYNQNGVQASVGYGFVNIDRNVDQFVAAINRLILVDYEADSDFFDARIRYSPAGKWAVGGSYRSYDNNGSFAVERTDLRAFVELTLQEHYLVHLGYRTIDYNEDKYNFDDYDADIAEFGIGFHW